MHHNKSAATFWSSFIPISFNERIYHKVHSVRFVAFTVYVLLPQRMLSRLHHHLCQYIRAFAHVNNTLIFQHWVHTYSVFLTTETSKHVAWSCILCNFLWNHHVLNCLTGELAMVSPQPPCPILFPLLDFLIRGNRG